MMPVFFLSTGLRTEWQMGGPAILVIAAALLIAAVGGKLLGLSLAGRILGWPPGQARTIGWLLQTKALIMIIFANILLDQRNHQRRNLYRTAVDGGGIDNADHADGQKLL